MLLSELDFARELEIYNEKEFDSLALVVQNPGGQILTFIREEKYFSKINENVSMVITTPELKDIVSHAYGVVVSSNPTLTFFKLHNFLEKNTNYIRPKYKTIIGKKCKISKLASIAKNNVKIGNNVIIEDFVTIYPNTIINDNCVICSGAKIGGQGFENKRCPDKTILSVNHYGGVIIGHDVDIHCNVCIDRAVYPWDNTVIGEYTKIDNLSHIAHAVKLGARCFVAAGTCFGGRTVTGDDCWFGIGSVIKNGLKIGHEASVTMGSVLASNVINNAEVSGFYAVNHERFLFNQYKLNRLK